VTFLLAASCARPSEHDGDRNNGNPGMAFVKVEQTSLTRDTAVESLAKPKGIGVTVSSFYSLQILILY
jgi:hypothetical protein